MFVHWRWHKRERGPWRVHYVRVNKGLQPNSATGSKFKRHELEFQNGYSHTYTCSWAMPEWHESFLAKVTCQIENGSRARNHQIDEITRG